MSIIDLAPELFRIIGDCLEINDAQNARLACKQIGEYLEPRLLSSLTICCTGHDLIKKQLSRMKSLARGEYPAIVRSVHSLSIGPWLLGEKPGPEIGSSISDSSGCRDNVLNDRSSQLSKTLLTALLCLTGVTSVRYPSPHVWCKAELLLPRWTRSTRDPDWAISGVVDALHASPQLRRLTFVQYTEMNLEVLGNVTSGLNELPDLEEIGVQIGTNSDYDREMIRYFSKALAASPNLENLSIINTGRRADGIPNSSVRQLFEQCSPHNPVHLKKLSLSNMLVNLDGSILPRFRHLISLHLVRIFEPGVTDKIYGRRFREDLLEATVTGLTLDQIWTALSSIEVQLQEITVDNVGNGFIDYISGYSGLKKLDIRSPWYPEAATSDRFGTRFYAQGLSLHTETLEILQVSAPYEGKWCFGPHNVSILRQCDRLKYLSISVNESRNWGHPSERDTIGVLLDFAASSFPRLDRIWINLAPPESFRNAKCGTGRIHRSLRIRAKISEHLKKFVSSNAGDPSMDRFLKVLRASGMLIGT